MFSDETEALDMNTDLNTGQARVREGSGEEGFPQVAVSNVKADPHRRRLFLDVEPHLRRSLDRS